MTEENKEKALDIIGVGVAQIVNNYSNNALLINACHVAADRYRTLEKTTGLSTTANIPFGLRLDNEIDVQYSNADLVNAYSYEVQQVVYKNYIIASVSLVDAILEDLYEHFIKVFNPTIAEVDLEKQIRNAWTNNNLVNYLTDPSKVNLQKPKNKQTEFVESFMRYSELRIVRHTLLHTNGKLSDKNYQKLQDNLASTPEPRKIYALANSQIFNTEKEVQLSINHILSIRQYLDRFLMYLFQSVNERQIA